MIRVVYTFGYIIDKLTDSETLLGNVVLLALLGGAIVVLVWW